MRTVVELSCPARAASWRASWAVEAGIVRGIARGEGGARRSARMAGRRIVAGSGAVDARLGAVGLRVVLRPCGVGRRPARGGRIRTVDADLLREGRRDQQHTRGNDGGDSHVRRPVRTSRTVPPGAPITPTGTRRSRPRTPRLAPQRPRHLAQRQRLGPAIRQFVPLRVGDGVVGRPELAQEDCRVVRCGPRLPGGKTGPPPVAEQRDPFFVLRKTRRDLDLAARRHAALETVGARQHALDQRLQLRRRRARHFAVHDIVRKIGGQPHLRHRVQQLHGRKQVVGDAVAMRLELNFHPFFVGDRAAIRAPRGSCRRPQTASPGRSRRRRARRCPWPDAAPAADSSIERGNAVSSPPSPVRAKCGTVARACAKVSAPRSIAMPSNPAALHPIEAVGERWLRLAGAALLHRPQRLIDVQAAASSVGRKSRRDRRDSRPRCGRRARRAARRAGTRDNPSSAAPRRAR